MFPASSLGGLSFAEIKAIIEALNTQAVAQSSGLHSAQQNTEGKAAVRDALHAEMEMITRTARAMAIDTPGLDDKFRLPRTNAERTWLTAAQTFHADALLLSVEKSEVYSCSSPGNSAKGGVRGVVEVIE